MRVLKNIEKGRIGEQQAWLAWLMRNTVWIPVGVNRWKGNSDQFKLWLALIGYGSEESADGIFARLIRVDK